MLVERKSNGSGGVFVERKMNGSGGVFEERKTNGSGNKSSSLQVKLTGHVTRHPVTKSN